MSNPSSAAKEPRAEVYFGHGDCVCACEPSLPAPPEVAGVYPSGEVLLKSKQRQKEVAGVDLANYVSPY